ncbi:tRNA (guanosine(37)-N1)-methyltransferase TrmD [Anaerofustis stercorihominis]|uniref:tRNA (guanine-N(1)-)-methyltransferase n=2 Tax=Anaerofustis stercorihominis TaxID=214853 RepID=B1CC25_9FIRM|nr:tRNA (guanosine(37)-N1)-methyltransferase TrmD [Anaerofustis stercorihominis]EDS71822.1 tRNA (guanine-N(1)-)-methyltransferase [Anaerofustis stercorihominis DSM 17244]MCQ4796124.1 tRNA (guanosine(37)-N1)-methyltransferase TrmD [Anaerofustis stercorihominis]RGD75100.1 tRNA (guanosine(37)-N1)-methyltransferase TrmD [Anaerofustis stercorihominis]
MIYNVLTLYPEMIEAYKEVGIIGRGVKSDRLQINAINIRDYSKDKHKRVDDEIYGGGAGMLMKAEPVYDCVKDIKKDRDVPVIYFSPRGRTFNSEIAKEYANLDEVILLCGHYEGIDQRAVDLCVDEEISIGDYILTGGHIASMVFMDTVSRYVDGVLGNSESYQNESFEDGLLEANQYTRPEEFMGMKVPEVLMSGHHKKIEEYYKEEALKETKIRREDLL